MGQNLTEDQKRLKAERRNKTMLERYGVKSLTNVAKVKQTKAERYGDPNYNNMEKNKQTCLERYGCEHHNQNASVRAKISTSKKSTEVQQKYELTMLNRYGGTNVNVVPEIRAKYSATLLRNYGVANPLQNQDIYEKHIQTMHSNNSYSKSTPEESLYLDLCELYGEADVERQYDKDPRYPWQCDFYIKSQDLFIEVNFHPTHGDHLFDPDNEEDRLLLEHLKKDNTAWSNKIVEVWAGSDYKKFQTAKSNHLNYELWYPKQHYKF